MLKNIFMNFGKKKDEKLQDMETQEIQTTDENIKENIQGENNLIPGEPVQPRKGLFTRLKEGLSKTRDGLTGKVDQLIRYYRDINEEFYEELEDVLISADVGVQTTLTIVESLRKKVKDTKTGDSQAVKEMLKEIIKDILEGQADEFSFSTPTVLLVVGVNGVGKTTTIGKIAHKLNEEEKKVLVAAGDTFRAAAVEQLQVWGDRVGVPVIHHEEGADPAAVIYDAVQASKSRNMDVLICDTAGRLHNKKNLMEELKKIDRVIQREYPEAKKEVFLVLDATTGQNAISQAKIFKEAVGITGIVLTKLDGTAKGGVVVAIKSELDVPVRFIGVGEGVDDLQQFNAQDFAEALF